MGARLNGSEGDVGLSLGMGGLRRMRMMMMG